ncbi:MAG: alpha/beta hydrolase family protein [Gammaproteobacteria bacterium]
MTPGNVNYRTIFLNLIVVLCTVILSACGVLGIGQKADTSTLYNSGNSTLTVRIDTSVELAGFDIEKNARAVQLKIFYPEQGGPYPLIVLSHGTFSSIERYDLIGNYWAARGYVVILPQHVDANYGVQPTSFSVMQNVALSRVQDMSLVLDELDDIEQQLPDLAGKIQRDVYVAAGHSIGTQVAMLVTGLQFRTSYDGQLIMAMEDRYSTLVLVSDPGKMRLMPSEAWVGSGVPTFMATGTDDYGVMGQRGEATEKQSKVLANDAPVDRYLLLLDKGDHYFGGLVQKDVDTAPDHEGLAIFNATSTAFLDAYTKGSGVAEYYLGNVDMEAVTGQRASLTRHE